MARMGRFRIDGLERLEQNLESVSETQVNQFLTDCAKELASRLLAKVIPRTPVGQYPPGSGKMGGTLRRGWTAGTNINAFVDSMDIKNNGGMVQITIKNPVDYASYVEYGHRTRNHRGWVAGKFMLAISEEELQTIAPRILERKVQRFLERCFE